MRHKQNTFLAGVAALTLFAASGAFAQQGQTEQKGGATTGGAMHSTQGAKSPGGMSQGGMNHGGMKQGGAAGQNAQSERQPGSTGAGGMAGAKSPSASSNRSAQESNKGVGTTNRSAQGQQQHGQTTNRTAQGQQRGQTNRTAQGQQQRGQTNAQSRTTQSQNGRFAAQPENRNQRGGATAQRNESLKGLQGNTRMPMQGAQGARGAGGNVTLNDQQRTHIRDTIINGRGAPRVGSVNFAVNVGTVVPRGHLHLVRVPETLVQIDPGWRGFLYFVYNDEVVIVDPHDMRIVEVLPV